MSENLKIAFGLLGGLALFLFGMNNMSDALQKAAGEKMKKILEFLTKNPVMGALAGALVTAVLQSSSATTVMVIGFVSAGLMSLPHGISVIFGANIGTTMTAQLMAQPVAAMYLASREIRRLADYGSDVLKKTRVLFYGNKKEMACSDFERGYETAKQLQENISSYITKMLSSGALTEAQSEQTAGLLVVTNNIERICDRCLDMSQTLHKLSDKKKTFSQTAVSEIGECFDIADELFRKAILSVENGDVDMVKKVARDKEKMRKAYKKASKAHFSRVKKRDCDANLTSDFSGILDSLDRIADNCIGIAEEAADHISFADFKDEAQLDGMTVS